MYRPESEQVSVFENESFFQFHGLNPDNDWVRLAKMIPWAELERRYAQTFDSKLVSTEQFNSLYFTSILA